MPDAKLAELVPETRSERLVSLDLFRGITIAGMILVNNPGSWGALYSPVKHADWNGLTPTDLVFPFFLFIVGVALPFSFDRRRAQGASRLRLFEHVVRRTLILFLLGLIMAGFPKWPQLATWPGWRLIAPYILAIAGLVLLFADGPALAWPDTAASRARKISAGLLLAGALAYFVVDFACFQERKLRVPGVLQRIAVCYFFAAMIVMFSGSRGRVLWVLALIAAYWGIVKCVPAPADYATPWMGARPEGVLHDWLDVKLLGTHLYSERPDPEGLLSTIPAIATVLIGVLAGNWLRSAREKPDKAGWLFLAANVLLCFGLWANLGLAVNKKIWTSSYVLVTGGLALHFLAACFWLVDVKGYRRWARPFLVLGTNAIAVYFASSVGARLNARPEVVPVSKLPGFVGGTARRVAALCRRVRSRLVHSHHSALLAASVHQDLNPRARVRAAE
jgi:predicted acyltransferase